MYLISTKLIYRVQCQASHIHPFISFYFAAMCFILLSLYTLSGALPSNIWGGSRNMPPSSAEDLILYAMRQDPRQGFSSCEIYERYVTLCHNSRFHKVAYLRGSTRTIQWPTLRRHSHASSATARAHQVVSKMR